MSFVRTDNENNTMAHQPQDKRTATTANSWLRLALLLAFLIAAVLLLAALIVAGYPYAWTGFATPATSTAPAPYKTLWDWLELLIIPATLLIGGYLLNRADKRRDDARTARDLREDREIAEQRTQETALQTYLDQMARLMLENALSSTPTPEAKDVARVWTLTVVRRVDAERKGIVLQFLHESKLLQRGSPIVNLTYADFSGADLAWAELSGADLSWINLAGADLSRANLRGANVRGADLRQANLDGADLGEADLTEADLGEAKHSKETKWPVGFDPPQPGTVTQRS
ncbi:MAG: pentapeptide repeat-containing protein [Caldilineaceae bacterium]